MSGDLDSSQLADPTALLVLSHDASEGADLLAEAINSVNAGGSVDIVSITACSLLTHSEPQSSSRLALRRALGRGARCRLVVLDPEGPEAHARAAIESPGVPHELSILRRDARRTLEEFDRSWAMYREQLIVRQATIGLGFNLWVTPRAARVEPYHLGQHPDARLDPDVAFQGLAHLWIGAGRAEYLLIADHFNQLWRLAAPRWPHVVGHRSR